MAGGKNKKSAKVGGKKQRKPGNTPAANTAQGTGKGSVTNKQPAWTASLRNSASVINTGTNGDIILEGNELVGVVGQWSVQGGIIFTLDLSPINWIGTRASNFARMYESFLIENLEVTYIPTCPTTTPGLVYMYVDKDPLDAPIQPMSAVSNISKLMNSQGAIVGPAWTRVVSRWSKSSGDRSSYFSSPVVGEGDIRQCQQGTLYAYSSASYANITGGLFLARYRVKFFTPSALSASLVAPTGWAPASMSGAANATPSTSLTAGITPIPNFVIGADSGSIFQMLYENPIVTTIGNTVRTLAPYTPIFLRAYSSGSILMYASAEGAASESLDDRLYGAASNLAWTGFSVIKLLYSIYNVVA